MPGVARLVAVGDLHGDLDITRKALRLAGAIDATDAWVGGKLVVVQTGDAIDRADGDRAVIDLLETLRASAKKAGGALIALSGNHEIMNVQLDFRYVTPGAFAAFADVKRDDAAAVSALARLDPLQRGRAAAFAPGGTYARRLAEWPIVMRVGDTIFVHGGLHAKHADYGLDRMNDEVRSWMLGTSPSPPAILVAEDGPVWTRDQAAANPRSGECAEIEKTLAKVGAKRMVIGHTPQQAGINEACAGKVWRIDVGLSHHYGGPLQVLEIQADQITVRGR